ncbi:MAG TPA: cytochrome b/b6 domain-containing protein [Blastocatellia bacterium]|nr:cytochrome b/b6 domain-containing protein [Blastocatellia bacterium]
MACHGNRELTKEVQGRQVSVYVNEEALKASVHGFLNCGDCHSDVKDYPHEPTPQKVSCGECHSEAVAAYQQSVHAKAQAEGRQQAATCLQCHGPAHEIRSSSDPASKVYRTHIPQTCGSCHGVKFVMEASGISARPFFSYQESVHGRAVAAGSLKAAVCTDCHRSHDILTAADPRSPIFKFNVPATCGQCHESIAREFTESIHGQAIRRGNWQAPVCSDCHGIHLIKPHIDPTAPVAAQALARTTCGQCHEGVRLSQEFGVASGRVSTYLDSYHGLATTLGSKVAANCASCHGVHNILPSSDPRSMIHKANLVTTCGKCHPGASENFARGNVHVGVPVTQDMATIVNRWVRQLYLWLIVVLIGGMIMHNALLWRRKALLIRQRQVRPIVRMNTAQRIQHLVLLTSFFLLVLTGFALKYPDSWLAWLLGSSESFRRIGHRVAGVVLLGVGIYHLIYIVRTPDGRQLFRDMRPVARDIYDLLAQIRFGLGRTSAHPSFGRFGYAEKVEYWAVVWGILIMGVTGLMVWFKVQTTSILPRWTIDVALTIHFYEAVLATLAIFVWHFYHVIFDPDVYPMNWAWWDGRVSAEWYQREHREHYETMMGAQQQSPEEEEREEPAAEAVGTPSSITESPTDGGSPHPPPSCGGGP